MTPKLQASQTLIQFRYSFPLLLLLIWLLVCVTWEGCVWKGNAPLPFQVERASRERRSKCKMWRIRMWANVVVVVVTLPSHPLSLHHATTAAATFLLPSLLPSLLSQCLHPPPPPHPPPLQPPLLHTVKLHHHNHHHHYPPHHYQSHHLESLSATTPPSFKMLMWSVHQLFKPDKKKMLRKKLLMCNEERLPQVWLKKLFVDRDASIFDPFLRHPVPMPYPISSCVCTCVCV